MVKRFATFLWMTPVRHLSPQIYPHTLLAKQFSLISKTYRFSVSCVSSSRIIKPFQGSICTVLFWLVGFLLPDWLCSSQIVRLYWNKLAASLSINQSIVGRSPAELSGPVSASLQLVPDTNHYVQSAQMSVWWPVVSLALWHRELDTAV